MSTDEDQERSDNEIVKAARGVVLSAIEEQAVLLMHDQADWLRDPGDYAGRFIAALLDIRRALGREWGWPDPHLPRWFDASSDDEDPAYLAGREDAARDIEDRRTFVIETLAGVELATWTEARLGGLKEAAGIARDPGRCAADPEGSD